MEKILTRVIDKIELAWYIIAPETAKVCCGKKVAKRLFYFSMRTRIMKRLKNKLIKGERKFMLNQNRKGTTRSELFGSMVFNDHVMKERPAEGDLPGAEENHGAWASIDPGIANGG